MSVLRMSTLAEILSHLAEAHKDCFASVKGVYFLKLWKQPNGDRLVIEEGKGVRIKEMLLAQCDSVTIRQHSHGTLMKKKALHTFESTLHLPKLIAVNAYNHSAEFISSLGVDFVYLAQNPDAKKLIMSAWTKDESFKMRAQWFKDEETEALLNDVGIGPKINRHIPLPRNLDLTGEDI